MTLSTTANIASYTGDGSTVAFAFPYLFYADGDLVVTVDGEVQGSGYSVSGAENPSGGTVTFNTAPADDAVVIIRRVVDYVQETDLENFDGNPADVTEKQFDLVVMQTQQLNEELGRALKFAVGSDSVGVLPEPQDGYAIGWDGTAGTMVNLASADEIAAAQGYAEDTAADVVTTNANVVAAQNAQAAAEAAASGMKWRPSVRAATTAHISLAAPQTVDGVSLVAGDRVLVKDQSTATFNGVYVVAAGAWTRATDADSWDELVAQVVIVEEGSTYADQAWICTVNAGGTLGSSNVTWTSFVLVPGAGTITGAMLATSAADASTLEVAGGAMRMKDGGTTFAKLAAALVVTASETIASNNNDTTVPTSAAVKAYADTVPGLVLLSTQTASNSAQLDFTSVLTSTYNTYIFEIEDIVPQTDNTDLRMRTSTNNGSAYDSGVSDYSVAGFSNHDGTASVSALNGSNSFVLLADACGNASGESCSGTVKLHNPRGTAAHRIGKFDMEYVTATPNLQYRSAGFRRSTNADIDAVRFYMSSGNITSGVIRCYGVKK